MMDYFAFMDMPRRFFLDLGELRARYVARSREFHPDKHTQGLQGAKDKSEELSGLNNQAYTALKDFDQRVAHVLALEGLFLEEGHAVLPQDFLMEMMDLHEEMMEGESETDLERMKGRIEDWEKTLLDEVRLTMVEYDEGRDSDLQSVSMYYLKNRYLKRLEKNLQAKDSSL